MIWVGTSGYNYPEWKGSFYPETLPASKMLPYYAERFPTVEINYTFYRAPNEKILDGWSKATPERFKLTLKGAEADHARCPSARLRRSRAPVPRDRRRARAPSSERCCFSFRPISRRTCRCSSSSSTLSAARVCGVRVPH
jgi:uncharacterized protein YecE (DUF72 family)